MAATMADDLRNTRRDLDSKLAAPEYNLNLIFQNLESLPDPLASVMKIVESRKKREAAEQQRYEANRKLQEHLARKHAELALEDRQAAEAEAEQMQDAQQPAALPEDLNEPETTEALCLAPPQPLPEVDLSPLRLPQSLSHAEAMALLQQLMATRQLFTYVGAVDGKSAEPVLRVLFSIVACGENPHSAYQQLVRFYNAVNPADVAWVPQLQDVLTALTTLGYQPLKGGGGGGRKRSTGDGPSPSRGAEPGGSGGGVGGLAPRLFNLQALLRLLADLAALHVRGRVNLGFGNLGEAAGKGLLTALLRMLLDPGLSALLHSDVCAALEGLMQPWDEPLWRRICDDAAAVAAALGPSHRAAYRVITAAQGLSERMRTWQQCAAMQLLRRVLPQGMAGGSGGASGSSRSHVGVDIRQVQALLGTGSAAVVKALLAGLGRSGREPREAARAAGSGGGGADYWRLLTLLQCAHLVVWTSAYTAEGDEADDTVRWITGYFKCVEQSLRGQQPTVMRIKVFLADVATNYELLTGGGE